uniref:Uncharacterized protein n=1 Tax=Anopheles coluzzii TaxID=1518534 RepID=A0A8W7PA30_ANOCL
MALRWWTAPQARWVRSREETSSSRRKRKFPAPGTRQQRWHRLAATVAERMNPRSGRPRMNLGPSSPPDTAGPSAVAAFFRLFVARSPDSCAGVLRPTQTPNPRNITSLFCLLHFGAATRKIPSANAAARRISSPLQYERTSRGVEQKDGAATVSCFGVIWYSAAVWS